MSYKPKNNVSYEEAEELLQGSNYYKPVKFTVLRKNNTADFKKFKAFMYNGRPVIKQGDYVTGFEQVNTGEYWIFNSHRKADFI